SRTRRYLPCLILLLATAPLGLPTAAADHGGCTGTTHHPGHHTSWTVTDLHRDYYAAGLLGGLARLEPVNGDADLYIWDPNCLVVLCWSTAGGTSAENCVAPPESVIEVRYHSGGYTCPAGWNGNRCIDYTLHLHLGF
ncbi:MAG TPA: hypothetical protein VM582_09470, partial [Candidatus Thermoplasmatota archaeon]|nr:hypothetical protein [Candidatus Thermoplasmatota archaeon]